MIQIGHYTCSITPTMTVTNFNTVLKQDAYVHVCVCVCLSIQRVEVAKLLQHLLLTGLSYLLCQKHFIYNSIDLHQGEGKVDAVDRLVQE